MKILLLIGIFLFYNSLMAQEETFEDTVHSEHHFQLHGHQPSKPIFVHSKKTPMHTFQYFLKHHRGKVIYVDFWASWCLSCMKEMKYLPALYQATANKDVTFLYVNLDENKEYWRKAVKWGGMKGYHFNAWTPEGQYNDLADSLEIISLPQYLLINKKGEIVSYDAPRPSKLPALIKAIDKLLLENDKNNE
ncbi:MAG: TlpA family protein disulfide reductase [Cytophagales bacterium]|nr:TlpA family protein disulfide reductase [Cytophagales bacterium]MDW8383487.1 TlpA disulfide reductase family protein [Flammeovirgaceae bacterium]